MFNVAARHQCAPSRPENGPEMAWRGHGGAMPLRSAVRPGGAGVPPAFSNGGSVMHHTLHCAGAVPQQPGHGGEVRVVYTVLCRIYLKKNQPVQCERGATCNASSNC